MPPENRAKLLQRTYHTLKKQYPVALPKTKRPMLDQLLFAVCVENATAEAAETALEKLKQGFFDLNEIRVSSVEEIAAGLGELADAEGKAARLRSVLQKVFESYYSFDVDSLRKQPHKVISKQLLKIRGVNDHTLACTIQLGMEGHTQPIDAAIRRALERLGLVESDAPVEAVRARLERLVPKKLGLEFTTLVRALAADVCWEGEPACKDCSLREICPTGQQKMKDGTAKTKIAIVKAAAAVQKAARAQAAAKAKARAEHHGRRLRAAVVASGRQRKHRN